MGLFGALYVGTSGLQTSQEALNVVAHNITNADTEGYTRQQVSEGTREYQRLSMNIDGVAQKQTGLGVFINEVRQVRDQFLDASYREEAGRKSFYETSYAAIEEVEEILGELDGATFYESLTDLWDSIEELVKDPSSEVCQSMFVQYAQSFVEASGNVYQDFADYQDKLDYKVRTTVDDINDIGHKIYKLNEKIRGIEAGSVENANDLKDQRNKLIDTLAEYGNVSYQSDFFGNILVKFEGHDFVMMDKVNEMAYNVDENSGFAKLYWPDIAESYRDSYGRKVYDADTAPVYNFDIGISSINDTDLGSLKAAYLARGDHRGNWTDLQTSAGYDAVKESVMMNVMAEFDGLVRNVVTAVNDVLKEAAEAASLINPNSKYMRDENGDPLQLFMRIGVDETTDPDLISSDKIASGEYSAVMDRGRNGYYVVTDSNGNTLEARYTKNANGDYIAESKAWFSVPNLVVNQDLQQYPTHLGFMMPDGSVDYQTAKALEQAFLDEKYILNPDLTNAISITGFYSNLVSQVSNSGNIYKSLSENQGLTVESIEGTRQGTLGVSTDEELSNMIKFQNAYNASSRFINVIDECTEHIINTLGT